MLKEKLYLDEKLKRMQTTRSIRDDLSVSRIGMQYFLQQGDHASRKSGLADTELHAPPIDTAIIRNRQGLVTILMHHSALSELESEVISLQESSRGLSIRSMDGNTHLSVHRAAMYNAVLERLVPALPREAAFSFVHDDIAKIIDQTTLRQTIEEWKAKKAGGIHAAIDLDGVSSALFFPEALIRKDHQNFG